MGWETRDRGGSYYYRKEREGERVRSVYVGGGHVAALAAQLDKAERKKKAARRARERRGLRAAGAEDDAFDALAELVGGVTAAHLLAEGFHTHKRQWRLIRGGKS